MGMFGGDLFSESLGTNTRVNVVLPGASPDVDVLPGLPVSVVYLLHGLGGNCDEWPRFSRVEYFAMKYNLVVIMPETQRLFWSNTPWGPACLDYVADELPRRVSSWLRVGASRERTFVMGESMGGYGALRAALARPDVFGAVAALSPVADVVEFRAAALRGEREGVSAAELDAVFGEGGPRGDDDLFELARGRSGDGRGQRFALMCGTEDALLPQTRRLGAHLRGLGFETLVEESPGDHEWPYWDRAAQRAIQWLVGLEPGSCPVV